MSMPSLEGNFRELASSRDDAHRETFTENSDKTIFAFWLFRGLFEIYWVHELSGCCKRV